MPENLKENKTIVAICQTCRTDLRKRNIQVHEAKGHLVLEYLHDPRDSRFPVVEVRPDATEWPKDSLNDGSL